MSLYKSYISPEQEESVKRAETVEQFLARGGKIQKVPLRASKYSKTNKSNKIDAQKLLDKAIAAGKGEEAIKFLIEQGFEVL